MSHDDDNVHHFSHVDCRRLVDLLGDYVDNQLSDAQRHAVDQHVGNCAPCTAFLRQYKFAPTAVRETLLRKVPVDLENRLLSFLRARTSKTPNGH